MDVLVNSWHWNTVDIAFKTSSSKKNIPNKKLIVSVAWKRQGLQNLKFKFEISYIHTAECGTLMKKAIFRVGKIHCWQRHIFAVGLNKFFII